MAVMKCLPIALAASLLGACGPSDNRIVGRDDLVAEHSCEALDLTPTEITAASDEASAAGVVMTLGETPYLVTLPAAGAQGFAMLRIDAEHTYAAMFVRERDAVVEAPGDPVFRKHFFCPDRIGDDIRMHIDLPGDYLVTFSDEGPREIWLQAVLEEAGHMEDAGPAVDAGPAIDAGI